MTTSAQTLLMWFLSNLQSHLRFFYMAVMCYHYIPILLSLKLFRNISKTLNLEPNVMYYISIAHRPGANLTLTFLFSSRIQVTGCAIDPIFDSPKLTTYQLISFSLSLFLSLFLSFSFFFFFGLFILDCYQYSFLVFTGY